MTGPEHGSESMYARHRCHCDVCVTAHRLRNAQVRAAAKARGFTGLTHGRSSTYSAGCKCEPCTAAATKMRADHRRRKAYAAWALPKKKKHKERELNA